MKLNCDRAPLLAAAQRCARLAVSRGTIPILETVKAEAEGGALWLTATDMDKQIRVEVAADIAETGAACANAALLAAAVKGCPEGSQVEIVMGEKAVSMTVRAGRARACVPCLPAADFPRMPPIEGAWQASLPADWLRGAIAAVAPSASTEETRYYLNGACVVPGTKHADGSDAPARLVATDGHRFALAALPGDVDWSGLPAESSIIVPSHFLAVLQRELGEGEARLALSATQVGVELEGLALTSRLIDGTFPEFERVVPDADQATVTATLASADLAAAIGAVGAFSEEKDRCLHVEIRDGALAVGIARTDGGGAARVIDAETEGTLLFGVNWRYLTTALDAIAVDRVRIGLSDAGSPIRLEDANGDRLPARETRSRLAVVMPMKVGEWPHQLAEIEMENGS